jgi:hypothetical protein
MSRRLPVIDISTEFCAKAFSIVQAGLELTSAAGKLATRHSCHGEHYRRGGSAIVKVGLPAGAGGGREAILDNLESPRDDRVDRVPKTLYKAMMRSYRLMDDAHRGLSAAPKAR